ncbi:uncharacterized protein LOC144666216 isoform X2 [Oculina patagonica]
MSLEKDPDDLPINLNLAELKEQLTQNGSVICPAQGCNQDFKSLWGLKYHVKQANHQVTGERKFKCEQCNLLFQSRVHLRQHRIADHSGSEGESPLTSPLSSPSDTTHQKTRQIQAQNSCTEVNESSVTNEATTNKSEENCTKATDVTKKKRGRPRKGSGHSAKVNNDEKKSTNEERTSKSEGNDTQATDVTKKKRGPGRPRKSCDHSAEVKKDANSHLTLNGQGEVAGETISSSQNSDGCALDNTSSEKSVVPRRTSTRVRTPRKDIFVYDESAEIERDGKQLKRKEVSNKNTPKKRGRPRKSTPAENVIGDSVGDTNCAKAPGKKRGRKRKCDIVVGSDNVDDENKVDDVDNDDNDDDDDDDVEEEEEEEEVDDDDDDDDDEWKDYRKPSSTKKKMPQDKKTGDGQKEVKPKKRGRKKQVLAESTRLKRLVKRGQTLYCKNEGCRAKFSTAPGYIAHQKICGVKEEEREKFPCEICHKVYMSFPGLQYHMKVNHTETEPVESSDHPEDNNEEDNEPEILPSGRARRKAASRAISKVQQLATDQDLEEVGQAKKNVVKKEVLEQLILKIKGRIISKEQEDHWTEALKTGSKIVCPCKGCSETFQSVASIKTHLESCEKAFSYKCLACDKVYQSIMVIHNHVNFRHVAYKPKGKDKSDSSDADYKVVSSGESEEDNDDVEIEEIEESGSDLNEELQDCTEEICVWDNKRKRYKKPGGGGSASSTVPVTFGPIGTKESEAYRKTEDWRKKEHKHSDLFPNLRPSASYWSRIDPSEIDQYLPEGTTSPQFVIRRKGDNQDSEHDIQLPLFGSTAKDDSSVYGDVTFNVGGPVWAMDWCPVPDSNNKEEQFLAISTNRSWDEVTKVHKCASGKGLIQIWSVGQLKADSASSGSTPTLSLGIAHNYGAIWDISWCPSGTWEPASSKANKEDGLPRLGVMAIACSDGCVRILSIPWPSALLSALDMADSDSHSSSYPPVIVSPTPHAVLMPCALGVPYNGESGQAWRAKWFPCSVHEKIATGFSDGTVAIWNLLTESPLLKEKMGDGTQTFRLAPFLHIATNSSVVKDLAWCPQYPDHLVTGSYDRLYKIWNLKSPFVPVTVVKRGVPHEIHWPVGFGTIVSCEDDAFQNLTHPSVSRYFTFVSSKEERLTSLATTHNSTIWTLCVSDWTSLLVSADASGEVMGVQVQLRPKKKKALPKFGVYRVYLEDLDKLASSKEQESKKAAKTMDMNNSDLKEKSQIDACIEKDINPCTSEEMESCANKETNACTSKERDSSTSKETDLSTSSGAETCADKERENATPPRSTAEVFQKKRLVFHDVNLLEFQNSISKSDPDLKRLMSPSTMQSIPYDNFINPQAIHKVRFNPNKQSFTWLASGGAAGLARLHLVKEVQTVT